MRSKESNKRAERPVLQPESILFSLFLVLVFCTSALHADNEGWNLLTKNRVEEAFAVFKGNVENGTYTADDLEGLFHIYRLKCYPEGCVDVNLKLLNLMKGTPFCVSYINRINRDRDYFDSFQTVYKGISEISAAGDIHPYTRKVLNAFMLLLEREKADLPVLKKTAETTDLLKHWNFTIGPFDSDGHSRLSRVFPPERDLSLEEYSYKGQTAARNGLRYYIDLFNTDVVVEKESDELVYLVSGLQTDEEKDVVISVYPPSSCRIWLNGFPVAMPEEAIGRDLYSLLRKVRFAKGMNVLAVKTTNGRIDIRLQNPDGSPFTDFTPAETIPAQYLNKGLTSIRGFRFSEEVENPLRSAPKESLAERLAVTEYFRHYGFTEDLRNAVIENNEFPEKSGFGHYLRTLYFQYAESSGNDLNVRMKNLYRRELDETIGLLGEYPLLLKLKGNMLIENKLFKEGKSLLDRALELSDGSAEVNRSLLSYFYTREWDIEIEKMYEKLVSMSPSFLDEYYEFLKNRGRYTQAFDMLQKAFKAHATSIWDYFSEIRDFSDTAEVERIAAMLSEHFPERRDDVCSYLGNYYYKQGDIEKAESCFREIYEKPDRTGYSHSLLAEIALGKGEREKAVRLWKERAALGKDIPGIYRRIRKEEKKKLYIMKYDVDVLAEFNEKDLDVNAYPESDFVNLLDLFIVEVHPDGSYEGIAHRAYLVVSKNGASKLGEIKLPEDADDTLYCRTISLQRDIFIPTSIKKADSKRFASMPNVVPGAVIDYAYTVSGKGDDGITDLSLGYTFGESEEPTLKVIQVIAAPEGTKLYFRNNKGKMPDVKQENGFDIYTWERENLEGLEDEPSMPPMREIVETGSIQGKSRFHSFQTGYFYDTERYFSSKETEEIGRKLCGAGKSVQEKVTNCLEWMREHLEDSGETKSLRDCIILGRAEAGMKMRLLTYWLGLDGIPCSDVYTNGQFFRKERRESDIRGLQHFSRNLLRIPAGDAQFPIWLDINSNFKYADHTVLDGNDINSCALYRTDGLLVIGRVKEQANDLKNTEYSFSLSVEETGDAAAESTGLISGGLAARLRKILKDNPQNRKKILESLAKKVLPRIHVKTNEFSGEEDLSSPVNHSFTGRILSFAKKENGALTFNPFLQDFNLKSLLGSEDRDFEYVLYAPRQERYLCTFTIPDGFYYTQVPERCLISSQYGIYAADFKVEGRTLECAVSVAIPPMRIPPESYGVFTGFLKEIIKSELSPVEIRKYETPDTAVPMDTFLPVRSE